MTNITKENTSGTMPYNNGEAGPQAKENIRVAVDKQLQLIPKNTVAAAKLLVIDPVS